MNLKQYRHNRLKRRESALGNSRRVYKTLRSVSDLVQEATVLTLTFNFSLALKTLASSKSNLARGRDETGQIYKGTGGDPTLLLLRARGQDSTCRAALDACCSLAAERGRVCCCISPSL